MSTQDLPETIPDSQPTTAEQLAQQIEALRSQVDDLASHKATLTATLLSLPASQQALTQPQQSLPPKRHEEPTAKLQKLLRKQNHDALVSTYRLGVGTTLFESKDPNPYAMDDGRITGIRFENFDRARKTYDKPHYVLLSRPSPSHPNELRIHKHTLPPSIQVATLASHYLSPPSPSSSSEPPNAKASPQNQNQNQNLALFAGAVRKRLMSLTLRSTAINGLQARLNSDDARDPQGSSRLRVKDVTIEDAECLHFSVEWEDGEGWRVAVDEGGKVRGIEGLSRRGDSSREGEGWRGRWEVGMRVEELGAWGEGDGDGHVGMEDG